MTCIIDSSMVALRRPIFQLRRPTNAEMLIHTSSEDQSDANSTSYSVEQYSPHYDSKRLIITEYRSSNLGYDDRNLAPSNHCYT